MIGRKSARAPVKRGLVNASITIAPSDTQTLPAPIMLLWDVQIREAGGQVTTPANAVVAKITDRMPLMLRPEDLPVWLGEVETPIADVKALIRTWEDCAGWEASVEDPSKKPPRPRKPMPKQGDLFS